MKFIHLSDLHLGKRVNGYSMIEDQKYILNKILNIIDDEEPDAVLIAGDVYDRTMPSAEAVELLDEFLVSLSRKKFERQLQTFVISGNHDSPERLAFGNRLMDASGIHLSPVYDGTVTPFRYNDEYGAVNIYMLPFIRPVHVRRFFPDEEILSYTDAMKCALAHMDVNKDERNVLITHQFITGASRSESEEMSVGGADNIDADVFEGWDYVALGHIHGPQNVGSERIRYCGTPLKYSFSEADHKKSVTVAELGKKGNLAVKCIPLTPLHDMKKIRGRYDELTARSFYENTSFRTDYMHITLTDEEDVPEAMARLRVIYKNLMVIEYDNTRTRSGTALPEAADVENKNPLELFDELYELQNGTPMSKEQKDYALSLIERIWEGGV